MFERERTLMKFMQGYLEMMLRDIDESEMDEQPMPGVNTPRWILGHLAIANDSALQRLGSDRVCDDSWHSAFGRGSSLSAGTLKIS